MRVPGFRDNRLAYGVLLADGRPELFPPCRPVVHGVMGVTSTGNLWNRETGNPATARAGYFRGGCK